MTAGLDEHFRSTVASWEPAAAPRAGATFVDTYTPSIGHDACQHSGTKWVEGLIPTSAAVPMHPNALGEQAMAREIVAALR